MGTTEMIYAAVASVIGGLVLLAMFFVQRQGQDASIDAVQYRTSKSRVMSLVEILERDFRNIGAYMYWNGSEFVGETMEPSDVIENTWYSETPTGGGTSYSLQFMSQTDSLQPPQPVQYQWEPIAGETVILNDGTERQLMEVRRSVNGTLTYSDRNITQFDVQVLEDTVYTPVLANLGAARIFKISVQSISPVGKANTVEETRFDVTYRPKGIGIKDNLN